MKATVISASLAAVLLGCAANQAPANTAIPASDKEKGDVAATPLDGDKPADGAAKTGAKAGCGKGGCGKSHADETVPAEAPKVPSAAADEATSAGSQAKIDSAAAAPDAATDESKKEAKPPAKTTAPAAAPAKTPSAVAPAAPKAGAAKKDGGSKCGKGTCAGM